LPPAEVSGISLTSISFISPFLAAINILSFLAALTAPANL